MVKRYVVKLLHPHMGQNCLIPSFKFITALSQTHAEALASGLKTHYNAHSFKVIGEL